MRVWGLISCGLLAACAPGDDGCAPFRASGSEVWLALGQSNAGNSATLKSMGRPGVMVFDGRRCLPAADPLPGSRATGGSVWTPLANRWRDEGRAPRILIVMRAEGATHVADWAPGGRLHWRVRNAVDALQARGLRPTRVLWHQGEADAITDTDGSAYLASLLALIDSIRQRGVDAPFHVSRVAKCDDAFSPDIRMAQMRATWLRPAVYPGPDTDVIPPQARHEKCHFADEGLRQAVDLWHAALAAPR